MEPHFAPAERSVRVVAERARRDRRRATFVARGLRVLALCTVAAACTPIQETSEDATTVIGPVITPEYTDYEAGAEVARLELAAPAASPFVLRATLPLQPGQYNGAGLTSPFVVVDSIGRQAPAQVEVVGRYANDADGADVVELLARVERPPGVSVGQRVQYSVQYAPHPTGPDLIPLPVVAGLMSTPNAFRIRTRDVFGHRYSANLANDFGTPRERVLRDGEVARQVRTYETMVPNTPVGGNGGTLPHMMGVHAYFTTWKDEQFISLDLRVNNGASGQDAADDRDDPLGDVYFESLELALPQGWTLLTSFDNPYFGEPYDEDGFTIWPIVAPIANGDMHYMPAQAQFHRRMVLCRPGAESAARQCLEERNLAFCRPGENASGEPYLSWWNPASARYFAQNTPLPHLTLLDPEDLRDSHLGTLNTEIASLRDGAAGPYPIEFPTLGWAHPRGSQYGGVHGGQGIHLYEGVRIAWAASADGYRRNQLWHRTTGDRHPTALWNKDGEPTSAEDWTVAGPNGPVLQAWMWIRPMLGEADPFGFGSSPEFQRQAVAAQGRTPSYKEALEDFDFMDSEHLVRYTRIPKTLAWLGNDAIAKDDLALQGELSRMSYHPYPQDNAGNAVLTGMRNDIKFVDQYPGQGFRVNRSEGWMIDAVVTQYALATPDKRADMRPWFLDLLDVFERGQSDCMGILGAQPNWVNYNGQYRTRQSISESIIEHALWGVRSSVFDGVDPNATERMRQVLVRSVYSMVHGPVWNPWENAPYFQLAVGPFDQTLPLFCGWVPPDGTGMTDDYQTWCSLAYGYMLTGDMLFVQRAEQMSDYDLPGLQLRLSGYVENSSAMLALYQWLEEHQAL